MPRRPDAAALAPFLAVVGGLVLLGAAAQPWFEQAAARTVGPVRYTVEVADRTGVDLAPLSVVAALAAVLCGVAMLVVRGVARRSVAMLAVVAGLAGLLGAVRVLIGGPLASSLDAEMTGAPAAAAGGALCVVIAGIAGTLRSGPRLPARYDVGAPVGDDEWAMASVGDENAAVEGHPPPPDVSDPTGGEGERQ